MNSSHTILLTCFLLCSARGRGTGYLEEGRKVKQGASYMILPSTQSSAPVRQLVHQIPVDSFGSFHRVPCNGSLPSSLPGHIGQ